MWDAKFEPHINEAHLEHFPSRHNHFSFPPNTSRVSSWLDENKALKKPARIFTFSFDRSCSQILIYRVAQKKRSKSNFFIIAEIIVCWIQSMDQSSTYLLSKRGPKDISIAFIIFEKQIRMWYMVEIAVNRLLKSSCFMFSCWPAPNSHKDCYNYASMSVNSSAVLFYTPSK